MSLLKWKANEAASKSVSGTLAVELLELQPVEKATSLSLRPFIISYKFVLLGFFELMAAEDRAKLCRASPARMGP